MPRVPHRVQNASGEDVVDQGKATLAFALASTDGLTPRDVSRFINSVGFMTDDGSAEFTYHTDDKGVLKSITATGVIY